MKDIKYVIFTALMVVFLGATIAFLIHDVRSRKYQEYTVEAYNQNGEMVARYENAWWLHSSRNSISFYHDGERVILRNMITKYRKEEE